MNQNSFSTQDPAAEGVNLASVIEIGGKVGLVLQSESVLPVERNPVASVAGRVMDEPLAVHPGVVLHDKFLVPHGLSANKLATKLGVPPNSIIAIINGTRGITGSMSLLLGRAFNVAPEYFSNLHMQHHIDLAMEEARQDKTAADRLARAEALAKELHLI